MGKNNIEEKFKNSSVNFKYKHTDKIIEIYKLETVLVKVNENNCLLLKVLCRNKEITLFCNFHYTYFYYHAFKYK